MGAAAINSVNWRCMILLSSVPARERKGLTTAREDKSDLFYFDLKLQTMRLSPLRVLLTLAMLMLCSIGFYDQQSSVSTPCSFLLEHHAAAI